jgi:hypothetical protein
MEEGAPNGGKRIKLLFDKLLFDYAIAPEGVKTYLWEEDCINCFAHLRLRVRYGVKVHDAMKKEGFVCPNCGVVQVERE